MEQRPGRPERVALVMRPGRDRKLVHEWLVDATDYEVSVASEPSALPPTYDICLLDSDSLGSCYDELRQRDAAEEAYLPHVLLLTGGDGGTAIEDPLIDEVVTLPVERATLTRRMGNLLAARGASVALAEREAQYRELLELTPEAVLLVDDEEIRFANAAAVELFGVAATELGGTPVSRFVVDADRIALEALLDAAPPLGEGSSEFIDILFRGAGERRIDASAAAIRVTYEDETVTQLLVQDHTDARRREERLRLFGRAVEAAAHGITVADVRAADNPIVYANAGFTEISGYPLGEVLGRNCRFLQGENTDEATVDTLRTAIGAGDPASVDILNYRKDGTPFWNRLEIVPIRDDTGELTHYLGLQHDITERVRNEQRLAVLDRILRHNVRNKTNVIRGYSDAIREGGIPTEQAADRIADAAEELYTISEQIREFDAVVRDTEETTETVDLEAVVGEGVTALHEEFREADVQLRASGSVSVEAHPTLRAALQDLLYQLGETAHPMADISLIREGDHVRLDVCDRGGAIPREDLDLVSTRSETPLEHLQGLELWLLRWAVEQSGGEFTVGESRGDPMLRMRFPAADAGLRDS